MRAVVFDLDETLIDRNSAVSDFAEKLWIEYFSGSDTALPTFISEVRRLDGNGYTPRVQFFDQMWECYCDTLPSRNTIEKSFFDIVWETPRLADGVIYWLQFLQRKNIPLAIVTNGSTNAQETKIRNSGIGDYFSAIVVSEKFGKKKPEPSIYKEATAKLGVNPGECWFVGDHPTNDIWGSKQVGFKTAWVHLNRPWAPEIAPCYDVKGETFDTVMDQIMEKL